MSKFKVGDKVRVLPHSWVSFDMEKQIGKIGTITSDDGTGFMQYRLDIGQACAPWQERCLELVEPRREFIVIRRDGAKTIAELRHNREVIKSGTAICNASDTFDFDTGAKLAFDRLMGREEPKPAPQPAHRFKVGDRVDTGCYGLGTVIFVDVEPDAENKPSYLVRGEKKWDREAWIGCVTDNKITSGKGCDWFNCYQLSPAPAPEPPKFYTGKVFAEKSSVPLFESRDGKVFEFVDGQCVNASFEDSMGGEIRNISHLREMKSCTTWHEVKSDV